MMKEVGRRVWVLMGWWWCIFCFYSLWDGDVDLGVGGWMYGHVYYSGGGEVSILMQGGRSETLRCKELPPPPQDKSSWDRQKPNPFIPDEKFLPNTNKKPTSINISHKSLAPQCGRSAFHNPPTYQSCHVLALNRVYESLHRRSIEVVFASKPIRKTRIMINLRIRRPKKHPQASRRACSKTMRSGIG